MSKKLESNQTKTGLIASAIALIVIAAAIFSVNHACAADDVTQQEDAAIRAAVERVAPSVVRIETFGGLERVGGMLMGAGPTTGLAVSADGYIVSSAFNFAQKPATILVHLEDGARLPATLVATDQSRKIVLLRVTMPSGRQLTPPVAAPTAETTVGQWSIAVGRTYESHKPSISVGIVSAVNRIWNKAVQTDAKISPANYGGPLIDIQGRVIGVLAPMSPMATDQLAGAEWYDSGIGFAVPLEDINKVLPRLEKGEDLLPGLLGISMKGIDIYAEEAELAAVQPNSPAYMAGFRPKDKIIEIDGQPIAKQNQLKHALGPHYAGDKVKIVALRGKERLERTVELVGKLTPYQHPFFGALPMRTPGGQPGVTLRYIYPDSPAAKAGAKAGDRLTQFEGKPIAKLEDLIEQLATCSAKQKVTVELHRGDETLKPSLALGVLPEAIPGDLPPAHGEVPAAKAAKPVTGVVAIKIPESELKCSAYVPESYNPRLSYGVVVWLHPPGGSKDEELATRFKAICEHNDLIVLAPRSGDPAKWQRTEVEFIRKTIDELATKYCVDKARTVVIGQEGAGVMAFVVAIQNREQIHGLAAIAAALPMGAQLPANDPVQRLAVYLGQTQKDPLKAQIVATITKLRAEKYPVTVKDLGPAPRPLSADELAELARWVDSLDRF